MSIFELIVISIALAMDCFSVSISCGLCDIYHKRRTATRAGLYFGTFQGLMVLGGLLTASTFAKYIEPIDHWVAFVLLCFIGGKMIYEAFNEGEERADMTSTKSMIILSIATSIDAFAAGIGLAAVSAPILLSVIMVFSASLILSYFGVLIGCRLSKNNPSKLFDVLGGVILLIIGTKILIEHLMQHQ